MTGTSLYHVTITDLVSYTATVAATSELEAKHVATDVLLDEIVIPSDLRIVERTTEAAAELDSAATTAARRYEVNATFSLDFAVPVPAASPDDAKRHAMRLYVVNAGPYEFDTWDYRTHDFRIREVTP